MTTDSYVDPPENTPCPLCGSSKWHYEMGEMRFLWHFRTCPQWHWYFDGGPQDVPRPFDHRFGSREEAAAALGEAVTDHG